MMKYNGLQFMLKVWQVKMNFLKQLKKIKKLNRKGKLRNKFNEVEDAEKKAVVSSLMIKCNRTKEEVLEAYDDFHLKHTDGSIQNEEYIRSAPITVCITLFFLLHCISSVSVFSYT